MVRATFVCRCGECTPISGPDGSVRVTCRCGNSVLVTLRQAAPAKDNALIRALELTAPILANVGSMMPHHEKQWWLARMEKCRTLDQQRFVANELRKRLAEPYFRDNRTSTSEVGRRMDSIFASSALPGEVKE